MQASDFPHGKSEDKYEDKLKELQLTMLQIEQAVWKSKSRVILAFEGFDSAGKGGVIRRLTQRLDPRGVIVHPIAAPSEDERTRHYLYRFWTKLPKAGTMAVFDRTWYGRVLVERVEGFAKPSAWRRAYSEINAFEKMLVDDGIPLVKIFLGISKDEQRRRFEDRLKDPFKQWKLTKDDIRNREKWSEYVEAVDEMFEETHTQAAPWHLVPADDKHYARLKSLKIIESALAEHVQAFAKAAKEFRAVSWQDALKELGVKDGKLE